MGYGYPIDQNGAPDPNAPDSLDVSVVSSWALVNLILAVLTVASSAILLIRHSVKGWKKGKEEENGAGNYLAECYRRLNKSWCALNILIGIVSVVLFLLTEDMSLPMQYIDRWTPLMAIIVLKVLPMLGLDFQRKPEMRREFR